MSDPVVEPVVEEPPARIEVKIWHAVSYVIENDEMVIAPGQVYQGGPEGQMIDSTTGREYIPPPLVEGQVQVPPVPVADPEPQPETVTITPSPEPAVEPAPEPEAQPAPEPVAESSDTEPRVPRRRL